MKKGGMRAEFSLTAATIKEVALKAGLKIAKTYPQSTGHIQIINTSANHASRDNHCSVNGYTLAIMRLIAALVVEGKEDLVSCKSVGY